MSPAPLQLSSPPQAPETTTSATFSERRSLQYSWAQSAATQSRSASRPASPAFSVRAVRASCRLRQLRCWVVPGRDSSSSASSVRRVPSLHSSVSRKRLDYTPAAIPPASASCRYRATCRSSRAPGRQPFWLLAQTVSEQVRPRLCRFAPRISVVAKYLNSSGSACSRGPSYPASTPVPRSLPLGRPGPGSGGRLPPRSAGLFCCSREPEVSLPRRSRARRPHTSRPPPPPHSASLRVLWHCQTLSRHPQCPHTQPRRLRDWTAP